MAPHQLATLRMLIVEDEYYLAEDARSALTEVGAEVIGPVGTIAEARDLIDAGGTIDGVLLDVNLHGEMAFEVADTLRSRGIPFAFVTGYDRAALPERFARVEQLQKPVSRQRLVTLLNDLSAASRN